MEGIVRYSRRWGRWLKISHIRFLKCLTNHSLLAHLLSVLHKLILWLWRAPKSVETLMKLNNGQRPEICSHKHFSGFFRRYLFRSAGSHGSESILPGFGAVMMLGGRQSGETFRSALLEPILNVNMLIVTFKILTCLTVHENALLLNYRRFWENAHDFPKNLQFVHGNSLSCIVGAQDFCHWWRWFWRVDFSEMGLFFRGQ